MYDIVIMIVNCDYIFQYVFLKIVTDRRALSVVMMTIMGSYNVTNLFESVWQWNSGFIFQDCSQSHNIEWIYYPSKYKIK